jgi:hypothetical protein
MGFHGTTIQRHCSLESFGQNQLAQPCSPEAVKFAVILNPEFVSTDNQIGKANDFGEFGKRQFRGRFRPG